MIRSFVFRKGNLVAEDCDLAFLKVVMAEDDVSLWVDASQPTPEENKGLLEGVFDFHPLSIEDCVAVSERPKVDDYERYIFMVMPSVSYSPSEHKFEAEELNIFVGRNFLVTYHHGPAPAITATIDRVKKNPTATARAPDRLIYTIMDLLLDAYDPTMEGFAAEVSALEDDVLRQPSADFMEKLLDLKAQIRSARQIVAPQRELLSRICRGEFKVVRASMLPYYRDLLDRLHRIEDHAEASREALTNILQVQLNLQQTQTNRVVKVLTVLATLSTPFVVVTSYYGMNFRNMPELQWRFAHAYVMALSVALTAGIYILLRRRRWL